MINNGGFAQQTYQQIKEHEIADKSMRHSCHRDAAGLIFPTDTTPDMSRSKEDVFMRDNYFVRSWCSTIIPSWVNINNTGHRAKLTAITSEIG